MIDIKHLLEDARFGRPSDHREAYSINTPHQGIDFLDRPIDLNNPAKWIRTGKTDVSDSVFERVPRRGNTFERFLFGPGIELEVDMAKPVALFSDGSAQVSFVQTDAYFDAVQKFEDAVDSLPDLEEQVSSAKRKAAEEAGLEDFDAGAVYTTAKGTGNKVALKNKQQAIAKKLSLWQANRKKAVKAAEAAAEDSVADARNKALTDSGISDQTIRLILNGSFEYYEATFRFLPTALDLARMFDRTVSVPTNFFLAVDRNDFSAPEADQEFSRKALKESYDSVNDGTAAFDDVRDCLHSHNGDPHDKRPFPIEKANRWGNIVRRFGAKRVPLLSFPRLTKHTFGQDGDTWDGKTGRVFLKMKEVLPNGKTQYVVMTIDGLAIIYSDLTATLPTTAIFVTPQTLAYHLRYAEPRPRSVPVNMIRRTFLNLADAWKEKGEMFFQRGGTRRYVP